MTNDENPGHDEELGAMLRSRGVPGHGPDFWTSVEDAIGADAPKLVLLPKIGPEIGPENSPEISPQDAGALADEPGSVIDEVPRTVALPPAKVMPAPGMTQAKSRSGRGMWVAIAAAAALVVGMAGFLGFASGGATDRITVVDVAAPVAPSGTVLPPTPMPTPMPLPANGAAPGFPPPVGFRDPNTGDVINDYFAFRHGTPLSWSMEPSPTGFGQRFTSPDGEVRMHVYAQVVPPGEQPVVPLIPGETIFRAEAVPVMDGFASQVGEYHQSSEAEGAIYTGFRDEFEVTQLAAMWDTNLGTRLALVMQLEAPPGIGIELPVESLLLFRQPTSDQFAPLLPTPMVQTPVPALAPELTEEAMTEGPADEVGFFTPDRMGGWIGLQAEAGGLYNVDNAAARKVDDAGARKQLYGRFSARFDAAGTDRLISRDLKALVPIGGPPHLVIRELVTEPGQDGWLYDSLSVINLSTSTNREVERREIASPDSGDRFSFSTGRVNSDGTDLLVERSLWQGACGWIDKISLSGELVPWPENPLPRPDLSMTAEEAARMQQSGMVPDGCVRQFDGESLLAQYGQHDVFEDYLSDVQLTLEAQIR